MIQDFWPIFFLLFLHPRFLFLLEKPHFSSAHFLWSIQLLDHYLFIFIFYFLFFIFIFFFFLFSRSEEVEAELREAERSEKGEAERSEEIVQTRAPRPSAPWRCLIGRTPQCIRALVKKKRPTRLNDIAMGLER